MDFSSAQTPSLSDDTRYGNKTRRLASLSAAGFPVPNFLAFPSSAFSGDQVLNDIVSIVARELPRSLYAVRSSALIEDSADRAHAGEFRSELAVSPDGLPGAIARVLDDAMRKLGDLSSFSILVQEYIEPDIAGAIFTRDPRGGLETIVEWTRGRGDAVVGGKRAERTIVVRRREPAAEPFPGFRELLKHAFVIELSSGMAEDIEWAIKDGLVFLLQARPITSLSKSDMLLYEEIERALPRSDSYFYARSPSLEAFAYPTPLALQILRALHAGGGPIDRVYREFGLRRDIRETFRMFGSALYVDREMELQEFYPSHSMLRSPLGKPRFTHPGGIFRTLRNMTALAGIRADRKHLASTIDAVGSSLSRVLLRAKDEISFPDAEGFLMRHYESVFLANLLSEKAVSQLSRLGAEEGVPLSILLSAPVSSEHVPEIAVPFPDGLVGNSLDPADMSLFVAELEPATLSGNSWYALSEASRTRLFEQVALTKAFVLLRERARWLSVALANLIRLSLRSRAASLGIEMELLFFASEFSLRGGAMDIPGLEIERTRYREHRRLHYPKRIVSEPSPEHTSGGVGISVGIAEGVLVGLSEMSTLGHKSPAILIVEELSPDVVAHFPKVAGIITQEGGILSHAAVTAREFGLPIVLAPDVFVRWTFGQKVRINGETGAVDPA